MSASEAVNRSATVRISRALTGVACGVNALVEREYVRDQRRVAVLVVLRLPARRETLGLRTKGLARQLWRRCERTATSAEARSAHIDEVVGISSALWPREEDGRVDFPHGFVDLIEASRVLLRARVVPCNGRP